MSRLKDGFNKNSDDPWKRDVRVATPPDKNRCPRGWDQDIWYLALLFDSLAERFETKLSAGRPVIYAELDARIKDSGIRTMEVPFSTEDMAGAVDTGDVYEGMDVELTGPAWRQFVAVMIYEFWTRYWDERATATFCEKQMFIAMWEATVGQIDPAITT